MGAMLLFFYGTYVHLHIFISVILLTPRNFERMEENT